jgi:outer membrane protein OmpA-like peptidoglycan-associated protein
MLVTKQRHSLIPSLFALIGTCLIAFLFSSCAPRPFVPVNEGREYGNPKTPFVVSHLPEANQWALARTKNHNVFQKIICFHYPCRKMIGRRKVLKAISMKKFKKRIKKNAKKGAYKNIRLPVPPPASKKIRTDSVSTVQDTLRYTDSKGLPPSPVPILKADSLITLNEFLFEVNSFKLKTEHFAELDLLSEFLRSQPTLEVSISGHTDNTGSEHHNVSLSLRRAEQVAQYLIEKGVMYEKVIFEGLGSTRPIAGNETEEGRNKNRRVEILIRNPKQE